MKIDDSLKGIPATRGREPRKAKSSATAAVAGHDSAGDSVEITRTSAQLSLLGEAMGQIDSTDAGKVEAIRLAIAEGRFQVDEEAVVDALVQNTMDLLRRQGKEQR